MKEGILKCDRAVVVLSFDDGRVDQLRTAMYLQEQRVPAVFNITTGYLEGKCPALTDVPAMRIEDVCQISESPLFEVAAHGDLHDNSVRDIMRGRKKILKLLRSDNEENRAIDGWVMGGSMQTTFIGYASPDSKMSPEFIRSHEKQLRNMGFSYVRTGSAVRTYRIFRKLCRKAGRILHFPLLYKAAYGETLSEMTENFCFTSVPIMADTTFREVEAIIDLAIRRNKMCVLMFHSVLNKGETGYRDLWTWDWNKFEHLVQYLKARQDRSELSVMTIEQFLGLRI